MPFLLSNLYKYAIFRKFMVLWCCYHTQNGYNGSWSVIMQKLMISIDLSLNDVFEGLELEEGVYCCLILGYAS